MSFKVRVKNFQSIADAAVEVHGFTVITGKNNSGKTALMRAIRGAFQNARGASFVRWGAAKTSVEIELANRHSIYWEKGKDAKPTYILDGGKPLHPGQAVPEEVPAMGVHAISAGGREIWPQFAPQFTGQLFLLDQPGSVLAEAVADVDRVSQLNQALRLSESDRRTANAELKVRRSDKTKIEDDLEKFDGLEGVESRVTDIEATAQTAVRIEKAVTGLTVIKTKLDAATDTVQRLEGVEKIPIPTDIEISEMQKLLQEISQFDVFRTRLTNATRQVASLQGVEQIQVETLDPIFVSATRVLSALDILSGLKSRRDAANLKISTAEKEEADAEQEAATADLEVAEFLKALGTCPICGAMTGPGGPDHEAHP